MRKITVEWILSADVIYDIKNLCKEHHILYDPENLDRTIRQLNIYNCDVSNCSDEFLLEFKEYIDWRRHSREKNRIMFKF